MGEDFDYAEEFKTLDVEALKRDVIEVMTTSQDWWPADYGHYGAAVHPDELALRRHLPHRGRPRRRRQRRAALRPAQQLARQRQPRQGAPAAVAGQAEVRPEDLLGRPAGLRRQLSPWSRWASRRSASASAARTSGSPRRSSGARRTPGSATSATAATASSSGPLGAVQMGLIYVNPEGPNGNPDPLAAARDIRETFRRMAMNDEETVALIAGGHTFGKTHGAGDRRATSARSRRAAPLEQQGLGWKSTFGTGKGRDAITSGLEVTWTPTPTKWDNSFFENLFGYEWELAESPAGAKQWVAKDAPGQTPCPDPDDPSSQSTPPTMLTTDLALRFDPVYEQISPALPGAPGPVRRGVRARPGTSCCTATWARSRATSARGCPSRSCGRTRCRRSTTSWSATRTSPPSRRKVLDSGLSISAAGLDRLGVGGELPRHRQARRRQRGADPARAAAGLGGQRAGRARQGAAGPRADPAGVQRLAVRREAGLAGRPDRAGRLRGGRAGGEERRARHHGAVRARAHGRLAGADRRRVVRGARADGRRVPQLPAGRREAAAGDPAAGPGLHADADRSGDDGAGRRPAGAGRQRRADPARRLHRPARGR